MGRIVGMGATKPPKDPGKLKAENKELKAALEAANARIAELETALGEASTKIAALEAAAKK